METPKCLECGSRGPIEEHHIAGKHNNASWTAPLCKQCHKKQTSRQWVHSILPYDAYEKNDQTKAGAETTGVAHILEGFSERTGRIDISESFRRLGQMLQGSSGMISLPKNEKLRKSAGRGFKQESMSEVLAGIVEMLANLTSELHGKSSPLTTIFKGILKRWGEFIAWCDEHEPELEECVKTISDKMSMVTPNPEGKTNFLIAGYAVRECERELADLFDKFVEGQE